MGRCPAIPEYHHLVLALEFLPWIPDDELGGAVALASVLEVYGLMDAEEARQLRVAIYRRCTAHPELVRPRRIRHDDDVGPELLVEPLPIVDLP